VLANRFPKLRFRLTSFLILMLGIAIGYSLDKWPVPPQVQASPGVATPLGLNLSEEQRGTFTGHIARWRGGMRVNSVQPNSAAARSGIKRGDILVGLKNWETTCAGDVQYAMSRLKADGIDKAKIVVLRDRDTLYGSIDVAAK
jgi:S1-C subfamily serine protease